MLLKKLKKKNMEKPKFICKKLMMKKANHLKKKKNLLVKIIIQIFP